jgi:hypothetical protein
MDVSTLVSHACPGTHWIEVVGSELARIEVDGLDLLLTLSAARVRGKRSEIDHALCGGHIKGVRWRLIEAERAEGLQGLMGFIGRIDGCDWQTHEGPGLASNACLLVPSRGEGPCRLTLTLAWGDTLAVQAKGWVVSLAEDSAFTPSSAC